jgi:hypothetical protein
MERSTHCFISFFNENRYVYFQFCWGALDVIGRVVPPHVCVVSVALGIVALSLTLLPWVGHRAVFWFFFL